MIFVFIGPKLAYYAYLWNMLCKLLKCFLVQMCVKFNTDIYSETLKLHFQCSVGKNIFLILSIIRGINYFNVLIEQRLKSYKGQIFWKNSSNQIFADFFGIWILTAAN